MNLSNVIRIWETKYRLKQKLNQCKQAIYGDEPLLKKWSSASLLGHKIKPKDNPFRSIEHKANRQKETYKTASISVKFIDSQVSLLCNSIRSMEFPGQRWSLYWIKASKHASRWVEGSGQEEREKQLNC